MDDLISRQDTINAIENTDVELSAKDWDELTDAIKSLPSATCDDCIWHVCNYNKVDWDGEDGYISRHDAINAIENTDVKITAGEWDELTNAIKSLPSAEPNSPLCALADRTCPFQGKEYAWCLTCPHISEEDRALVKKVVAKPMTRWIPVSERLPSDGGNYLITVADLRLGHIGEHTVTMADFYVKEKKWNSVVDVYAWMPLPEPYREDGEA